MTVEEIRRYCRSKKGITEELPFGPSVLVFKVMGKMFALLAWEENPLSISLKCDPERAAALRAYYPAIRGAYHMNKNRDTYDYYDKPNTDIYRESNKKDIHLRGCLI